MPETTAALTFLGLTRRHVFRTNVEAEDFDKRISLFWPDETAFPLSATLNYDGILVDGVEDLGQWQPVLAQLVSSQPILVVASVQCWQDRNWLAQIENVTVVKPSHPDLVEHLGFLVERQKLIPRVAVYSQDESLLRMLPELGPGVTTTGFSCPNFMWGALEEKGFDVIIIDLNQEAAVPLARALRQEQRGTSMTLLGWGKSTSMQVLSLFDTMVGPAPGGKGMRELLLGRFRRGQSIRRLIENDALTGLLNRRRAKIRFAFLVRLARRQRVPLALAILDIDHFKQVNDKYTVTRWETR